jgi:hypothetical protein
MRPIPPPLPPSTLIRGFHYEGVIYRDLYRVDDEGADCCLRHDVPVYIAGNFMVTGDKASAKALARSMGLRLIDFRGFATKAENLNNKTNKTN